LPVIRIETLPGTTDSPAIARELIRSEMADCNDDAVAAAELMISELVTNAVVHGATSRRVVEPRPAFQRLVKWRTGSEGRIRCLKRDFGWNRTQIDGLQGARIWCGHGVFNHNLVKIAALVDAD
jgi:IS5 family transposase